MVMTNYMALLAANQPWNLILFMVIPMGTAELLVATEFFTLYYSGNPGSAWRSWNRWVGMLLGIYYLLVTIYLLATVIPSIQWRGIIDQIAVIAYLLGVIPMFGITLIEWNLIGKHRDERGRSKLHAMYLIAFLILGHIAMIFGMADPQLAGYQPPQQQMQMNHDMGTMKHDMSTMQQDGSQQNMSNMNHDMNQPKQ